MKKYLMPVYDILKFIRYFIKFRKPVGIINSIWCFFNGFFTKNFVLFSLEKKDRGLFISDYQDNFKIGRINRSPKLINNKLVFLELIDTIVSMPAVKGIIEDGKFISYGYDSCQAMDELLLYIQEKNAVIFKPIDGDGGENIYLLSYGEGVYQWNNISSNEEQVKKNIEKLSHHFISDVIQQHEYSRNIYPYSVNTIRILTMKDPVTNKAFIAVAAHRIGNDVSRPVDNCAKGGFTSNINLRTGVVGKAVRTYFKGLTPEWYEIHPDSGSKIESVQIPDWDNIKQKTLELADKFSFLEYIGWDIVVLPDGNITILEANDCADLKLHQVHEPLLKNERIKEFYSFHKAL